MYDAVDGYGKPIIYAEARPSNGENSSYISNAVSYIKNYTPKTIGLVEWSQFGTLSLFANGNGSPTSNFLTNSACINRSGTSNSLPVGEW